MCFDHLSIRLSAEKGRGDYGKGRVMFEQWRAYNGYFSIQRKSDSKVAGKTGRETITTTTIIINHPNKKG